MTSRVFIVLCPNGRRQQVKVSPHSSNLQILEDACRKQGLKWEEFELKHYNKTLDLASTVHYSNLPNNAQLELVRATTPRRENQVQIGLQLEDGQRLLQTFPPTANLWEILNKFQETTRITSSDDDSFIPVCVYMRREIAGEEMLRSTSLRSLGLVGGNAVIRFFHRPSSSTADLASSAVNLASSTTILVPSTLIQPTAPPMPIQPSDSPTPTRPTAPPRSTPSSMSTSPTRTIVTPFPGVSVGTMSASRSMQVTIENRKENEPKGTQRDLSMQSLTHSLMTDHETTDDSQTLFQSLCWADMAVQMEIRNAFLFSLDQVQQLAASDVPDEFFKVTTDDVKFLMADLKRKRQELENAPLLTQEMRAAEMRHRLEQYSHTVIRIHFPDRLVLQGNFKVTETVADVMSFVRHFLSDQNTKFYLFTTPPKRKLVAQEQLMAALLVPGAVVYIGCDTNIGDSLIHPEMRKHLSSPEDAIRFAAQNRPSVCYESNSAMRITTTLLTTMEVPPEKPALEHRELTSLTPVVRNEVSSRKSPIPKWLKLGTLVSTSLHKC